MSLNSWEVGISLIGPPGSGKSTLGKEVESGLPGWTFHDQDNHGFEHPLYGLDKNGGVERAVQNLGDAKFLAFEKHFTCRYYGRKDEGRVFHLDNTIIATSGSIVKSPQAIGHLRDRTHVILRDVPVEIVLRQINERPGGAGRIVGMNGGPNGELPESENLEEELKKRANLYQKYAHSVLPFVPGEGIKESANRLHAHILKILQ